MLQVGALWGGAEPPRQAISKPCETKPWLLALGNPHRSQSSRLCRVKLVEGSQARTSPGLELGERRLSRAGLQRPGGSCSVERLLLLMVQKDKRSLEGSESRMGSGAHLLAVAMLFQ